MVPLLGDVAPGQAVARWHREKVGEGWKFGRVVSGTPLTPKNVGRSYGPDSELAWSF